MARISKLDVWNTFAANNGKFKTYPRDELIALLSRSVVTYWIDNGYLAPAFIRKRGKVLKLTTAGEQHLVSTTKKWLSIRPSRLEDCEHPHPDFL